MKGISMNHDILKDVVLDVLKHTPYKPYLCLPLSALLYCKLKDDHNIDAKLVTGDLAYKGEFIFKQDFKISQAKNGVLQEWAGHSWVEIENFICDLSFFRTLYSDEFTRPYRNELIEIYGEGRGCLIFEKKDAHFVHLSYTPIDYLSDDMATGIINGFKDLIKVYKN